MFALYATLGGRRNYEGKLEFELYGDGFDLVYDGVYFVGRNGNGSCRRYIAAGRWYEISPVGRCIPATNHPSYIVPSSWLFARHAIAGLLRISAANRRHRWSYSSSNVW